MTDRNVCLVDRMDRWWTVLAEPGVVSVFAALTVPLVVGTLDARLHTPLAVPGYTLFVAVTVVGERIVPQYAFRLYWIPFVLCCYAIAIVVTGIARACFRRGIPKADQ